MLEQSKTSPIITRTVREQRQNPQYNWQQVKDGEVVLTVLGSAVDLVLKLPARCCNCHLSGSSCVFTGWQPGIRVPCECINEMRYCTCCGCPECMNYRDKQTDNGALISQGLPLGDPRGGGTVIAVRATNASYPMEIFGGAHKTATEYRALTTLDKTYAMSVVGKNAYVCPLVGGKAARGANQWMFCNHVCDPGCNTIMHAWFDTICGIFLPQMFAICDIKPGEEVSVDYSEFYAHVQCFCGRDFCRGYIGK